jgi:hypothetical protein
LAVSSDASDSSVEDIFRDESQGFVRAGPVRPQRPPVEGSWLFACLTVKRTSTFAYVKRSMVLQGGFVFSCLARENVGDGSSVHGQGCFRDLEEDSALKGSFIGCGCEYSSVTTSDCEISFSGFNDMKVFGCDRVCEVKWRIEAIDGIPTGRIPRASLS